MEEPIENYKTGWISLYRSIKNHWIFDNPNHLKWWLIMLFDVNHEPKNVPLGYTLIEVKRGQSIKSLRTWALEFNTGTKTVVKFFDMLEKDGMITKKTIGKGKQSTTLVNINNYDTYQHQKETLKDTLRGTQEGTLREHKVHTNNNENNYNNKNTHTPVAKATGNNILDLENIPPKNKKPSAGEEKEKSSAKKEKESFDWEKLLNFININTGRKFQIINKTVKASFKSRLNDGYTKQQIQNAIINASKDKHHNENNNKWLTPEYFAKTKTIDLYADAKSDSEKKIVAPSMNRKN